MVIERIPKDVLKIILAKLNSSSLIKFCIASKYVNSVCLDYNFRLYYFDQKYNLKYSLMVEPVAKLYFCHLVKKYISIIKNSESVAPKKIFIDEHKICHNQIIQNCDMCMYVGLNDFEMMLKLYLYTYPHLFFMENQTTLERSRLNAENIIFLFKKAYILTGILQIIPTQFIDFYCLKKSVHPVHW